MPETALASHVDCDEVARIVAAALPSHADHAALLRQDDALGLATELLRAMPEDDSERARGIREGLEIAIRVALIRVGLPNVCGTHQDRTETNHG